MTRGRRLQGGAALLESKALEPVSGFFSGAWRVARSRGTYNAIFAFSAASIFCLVFVMLRFVPSHSEQHQAFDPARPGARRRDGRASVGARRPTAVCACDTARLPCGAARQSCAGGGDRFDRFDRRPPRLRHQPGTAARRAEGGELYARHGRSRRPGLGPGGRVRAVRQDRGAPPSFDVDRLSVGHAQLLANRLGRDATALRCGRRRVRADRARG